MHGYNEIPIKFQLRSTFEISCVCYFSASMATDEVYTPYLIYGMADKLLKRHDKSWIKSFYSFIAIDAFLLNKKTEGKQSKNIYFPIRFAAWTCLKNAF